MVHQLCCGHQPHLPVFILSAFTGTILHSELYESRIVESVDKTQPEFMCSEMFFRQNVVDAGSVRNQQVSADQCCRRRRHALEASNYSCL